MGERPEWTAEDEAEAVEGDEEASERISQHVERRAGGDAMRNERKYLSTHPDPPPGPPSTPMHVTVTRRDDGYLEIEWRIGILHRQKAYLTPEDADDLSAFIDSVRPTPAPDVTVHGDYIGSVDLDA